MLTTKTIFSGVECTFITPVRCLFTGQCKACYPIIWIYPCVPFTAGCRYCLIFIVRPLLLFFCLFTFPVCSKHVPVQLWFRAINRIQRFNLIRTQAEKTTRPVINYLHGENNQTDIIKSVLLYKRSLWRQQRNSYYQLALCKYTFVIQVRLELWFLCYRLPKYD